MDSAVASAWIGAGSALAGAFIGAGGSVATFWLTQSSDHKKALREAAKHLLTLRESLESAQRALFMAGVEHLDVRTMPLDEFYVYRDTYYDLCRDVIHGALAIRLLTNDSKILAVLDELETICGNQHRGDPISHGGQLLTEESDALRMRTAKAFDDLQKATREILL